MTARASLAAALALAAHAAAAQEPMSFRLVEANTAACEWHGGATFTCRTVTTPVTVEIRFAPRPGRTAALEIDGTTVWGGPEPGARELRADELPAGGHRLGLSLTDGGVVAWRREFHVDVVRGRDDAELPPPVVAIARPAEGAIVAGDVPVEVRAYNPLSDHRDVARVELFVDGASVAALAAPPWRFTWDARAAAPGRHELRVRASAASGKASEARAEVEIMAETDLVPGARRTLMLAPSSGAPARETIEVSIPFHARKVVLTMRVTTAGTGLSKGTLIDPSGRREALFTLAQAVSPPVPLQRDLMRHRGETVTIELEASGEARLGVLDLRVVAFE